MKLGPVRHDVATLLRANLLTSMNEAEFSAFVEGALDTHFTSLPVNTDRGSATAFGDSRWLS